MIGLLVWRLVHWQNASARMRGNTRAALTLAVRLQLAMVKMSGATPLQHVQAAPLPQRPAATG
jgi:hypothetical protein